MPGWLPRPLLATVLPMILPVLTLLLAACVAAEESSTNSVIIRVEDETPRLHVLLVSIPYTGHVRPLLAIADQLVKHGHVVTFASTDDQIAELGSDDWNLTRQPGFQTLGCGASPVTADMVSRLHQQISRTQDLVQGFLAVLTEMAYPHHQPLARCLLSAARTLSPRIDVVVTDRLTYAGWDVAHALGLPLVINSPSFLRNSDASVDPLSVPVPYTGFPANMTWMQRLYNAGVAYWRNRRLDLDTLQHVNHVRRDLGFAAPRLARRADMSDGTTILVDTVFGLELPRQLNPNVHLIGPCVRIRRQRVPGYIDDWLARPDARPVVLVALGTVSSPSPQQVSVLAHVMAAMPEVRFLAAAPDRTRAMMPASLRLDAEPQRVLLTRWLPQHDVLCDPRVSAFLTHGGINSVHESLQCGQPMVVLPFLPTNADTAARVVDAGCGLRVGTESAPASQATPAVSAKWPTGYASVPSVATALQQVLTDPSFRIAAKRVQQIIRASGGAKRAVTLIEAAVLTNGTHHLTARESRWLVVLDQVTGLSWADLRVVLYCLAAVIICTGVVQVAVRRLNAQTGTAPPELPTSPMVPTPPPPSPAMLRGVPLRQTAVTSPGNAKAMPLLLPSGHGGVRRGSMILRRSVAS